MLLPRFQQKNTPGRRSNPSLRQRQRTARGRAQPTMSLDPIVKVPRRLDDCWIRSAMENNEALHGNKAGLGRVTIEGAPGLADLASLHAAALTAAAAGADVVIDCAEVQQLSAAVAQILIALKREVESAGRRFQLANVPATVQRFLDLTGLGPVLADKGARS
jgi:ABC-type transporter Mla MlaB component